MGRHRRDVKIVARGQVVETALYTEALRARDVLGVARERIDAFAQAGAEELAHQGPRALEIRDALAARLRSGAARAEEGLLQRR